MAATIEATQRFAERFPEVRFRELGRTGLKVSVLGFGGYRVDDETLEHRAALDAALRAGCNLIDTSTNYTDGGSERLIGSVLKDFAREEIVLVSKVGYVQGQNLALAQKREAEGKPFAEMVRYMEGCWHCLHPDFIADQLTRSLQRLQVDCLDVYLLHNPEYFFSDAQKRRDPRALTELRNAFYDRVARAFAHLEKEVANGRIRAYGVSSNTFGSPESDPEATSLARMWQAAESLSPNHHFSVVQLPLNLFESGPALEKNNQSVTVLEFARGKNLGVLVNRPLNAIVQSQMFRLADFPKKPGPGTLAEQLNRVSKLEDEFVKSLAPFIETGDGALAATDFYRWSRELATLERQPIGLEQWGQLEAQVLYQNQYMEKQLDGYFGVQPTWRDWRARYTPQLKLLLDAFHNECAERSQRTSTALAKKLEPHLPADLAKETFSRKALAVLINTAGTTCILNGMRQPAYVTDAMGAARLPAFEISPELYLSFKCHS